MDAWVRAPQLTYATERRSVFRVRWIDNDTVRTTLTYDDRAVPVALHDLSVGGARFVPLTSIDLERWASGARCVLRLEGPTAASLRVAGRSPREGTVRSSPSSTAIAPGRAMMRWARWCATVS